MSTILKHRNTSIITLEPGEALPADRKSGDILLIPEAEKWWTHFVGEQGELESYDAPFDNYNKALWTAKAAAEFAECDSD